MHGSPRALPALILGLTLASSLPSQAPTYTPFGTGCPGSMGVPVLTAGGDLPCIGTTFTAVVTNYPFPTLGIGITGDTELYGSGVALTALTQSNTGQYRNYREVPTAAAQNILISAQGGTFNATGALIVTAYFTIQTPDTTV